MARLSRLRVLNDEQMNTLHDTTVQILETVGVELESEKAVDIFGSKGAKVEGNRVFIPKKMLEEAIEAAPESFKMWGRDEEKSIIVGGDQPRPLVEPSNGPVFAHDMEGGRRKGTMEDLVNFFKLAQASPVCDIAGAIPVEPAELSPEERLNRIYYEMIKHSDKPLRFVVGEQDEVLRSFEMLETAMGKPGFLKEHTSVIVSINPLSPLAYDRVPLETMITYAEHNQAVTLLSCALAGVSAPISVAGAAAMINAEMLAGLTLLQLVNPGTPYVHAPASAMPNLQTGQYITGSPQSNLINNAVLQVAIERYKIPTRTMAGMTDAKVADAQSGYETMQSLMQCMLGGAHIINESLGVLDSIMVNSFEKFVMDEEMISRVFSMMQGVPAQEEDFMLDIMQTVGPRGTYLTHASTFKNFRSAWRPTVSCWESFDKWEKAGSQDALARANAKYKAILAGCPDTTLTPEREEALKAFTGF
ncbi:MAG: trimethylamine methyltransferase family protein [Desulfobacterales bacterium]|nr:trimethylamine methyltransferase family protein [Desulfobacterales bacterium]